MDKILNKNNTRTEQTVSRNNPKTQTEKVRPVGEVTAVHDGKDL